MKILLVVTGWNCQSYVRGALMSIQAQTRQPDHVVIIDDGSSDDTHEQITKYMTSGFGWFVKKLPSNYGTAYARDEGISAAKRMGLKYDIIVLMDLDDLLFPESLATVEKAYADPNVWLTYGNYIDMQGKVHFNEETIKFTSNDFRNQDWKFVHLRTFRRQLYEKLTYADIIVPYTPIYPDANMLYCLLELAGLEHIKGIPDVLYRYVENNPLCVLNRFKNQEKRDEELNRVKAMKPKKQLTEL